MSSWIGGCSLLSKSLKAKLKQDDGCDDDDAVAAAVAANRLIMLVNPIVPLALALTFNNSQNQTLKVKESLDASNFRAYSSNVSMFTPTLKLILLAFGFFY